MPFTYQPYQSRFTQTIGDLLLRRGDIAARQAEMIGAAQARNAEAQGQIWGGFAQNIGQLIGSIPSQIQQARATGQQDQLRQQQIQMNAGQLEQQQRQLGGERALSGILQGDQLPAGDVGPRQESYLDPNGLFDVPKITQALGQMGYGDRAVDLVKGAQGINDAIQRHQELEQKTAELKQKAADAQTVLLGQMAFGVKKLTDSGVPIEQAIDFVAKPGLATQRFDPNAFGQVRQQLLSLAPEQQDAALTNLMDQAAQIAPKKVLNEGARETDLFGRVTATGGEKPPTMPQLAVQAVQGNQTAQQALDRLKPPPAPRPIEEQLLEAIASGDTTKANQIKETLRTKAEATKDPAVAAQARELAGLRADEARARLDAMRQKAAPVDVSADIQTTRSGRTYIDLSQYQGEERNKAREAAAEVGAVPVSKEQANALQEIDNARLNQRAILDQVKDLLPKDAAGRLAAAPGTALSRIFQTDEQKAAFNSWRTAAIQTLRATAGSKGLRINQAEIAQAIENDIPKLTDTYATAQQKVKNIETMLENAEQSILIRDRSVRPVVPPTSGPTTPTSSGPRVGEQRMINGQIGEWDGHGWKPVIRR